MTALRSKSLFPVLWAAALAVPSLAGAVDTAGPPAAASDTDLAEVVVTAQKRIETLREVPQSVSVLSGSQLEDQHIDNYADLATAVPSLSYSSWGGPGLSNLEIRGISSTIGESTVSIYLDDAPITIRNNSFYSGQPEPQLFDLARAEVLRGPQGTLYGASAMGGTIKLVSNPVKLDKFEGDAYGEMSGTRNGGFNYVSRGILNVPIVDGVLGLRMGLQVSRDSGYVDYLSQTGQVQRTGINSNHAEVAKLALTWSASQDLTITAAEFAQRTTADDTGLVNFDTPNYFTSKLVLEPGKDTFSVSSLKMNYDLHWADVTAVSSYAYRHFPRTTDGTFFNSEFVGFFVDDILGLPGADGNFDGNRLAALPGPVYNSLTTRQFTQEIRLASKAYDPAAGGAPLSWIAGLYYSDSKYYGTSAQYIPGFNTTFQSVYGIPPEEALGSATPNDLFYQFVNNLTDREFSVFGELSYFPTPRLKLTAGMRELFGRDSETDTSSGFFASTPFHSGHLQANAFTPKVSASFDITPSVTTYATAGKGFRLGGIDAPVPAVQCAVDLNAFGLTQAPDTYRSDKVWNYEIGAKGLYFDRTTSLNASLYDIEWDQIQLDVPLKTCGFDFIANLGHARSYGTEVELLQKVGRSLTLGLTGQYNHDTFTQDVAGLGITKGDMVPGAPRWSYGVTTDYAHNLTGALGGFFRANWQYVGTSHGTFVQGNPDYLRTSYGLLGLSLGVNTGLWEVSLYAKNLLNEKKIIQSPADNFVAQGYTPVPRIIGVTGNVRF